MTERALTPEEYRQWELGQMQEEHERRLAAAAENAVETLEEQRQRAEDARQQHSDGPGVQSPPQPPPDGMGHSVAPNGAGDPNAIRVAPGVSIPNLPGVPPTTRAFATGLVCGIVIGGVAAIALRRARELPPPESGN